MIRKIFVAIIFLLPNIVLADSWNSDLIKFKLEDGNTTETMTWISGYSYAATAIHHRLNCLPKSKYIDSKYLIEVLNSKYAEKTITSEQATEMLDEAIRKDYPCKTI